MYKSLVLEIVLSLFRQCLNLVAAYCFHLDPECIVVKVDKLEWFRVDWCNSKCIFVSWSRATRLYVMVRWTQSTWQSTICDNMSNKATFPVVGCPPSRWQSDDLSPRWRGLRLSWRLHKEVLWCLYASYYNCPIRCNADPTLCSGPKESVLEQEGGIWSSNNTENPFADHFKIFIHYCSSDSFAGAN